MQFPSISMPSFVSPSAVASRVQQNYQNMSKSGKVASIAVPVIAALGAIATGVLTQLGFVATPIGASVAAAAALVSLVAFAVRFLKTPATQNTPVVAQKTAAQRALEMAQNGIAAAGKHKGKIAAGVALAVATGYVAHKARQSSRTLASEGIDTTDMTRAQKAAFIAKGTGYLMVEDVKNLGNGIVSRASSLKTRAGEAVSSAKDYVAGSRVGQFMSRFSKAQPSATPAAQEKTPGTPATETSVTKTPANETNEQAI